MRVRWIGCRNWLRIDKVDGSEEPVDEARVAEVLSRTYNNVPTVMDGARVGDEIPTAWAFFRRLPDDSTAPLPK